MSYRLISDYQPTGDQPQAIDKLVAGIKSGKSDQVLLGVTGSGKTFTIANVIAGVQKPTLVIAHNKTLAAQLYQEFKEFFPESAVSYFVSYYDFYQPEAYIPQTDTYIEKETEINEEIDKLRLQATTNLLTRNDAIVVASVSCIYNLGSPVEYGRYILELPNNDRHYILERLVDLQYERSEFDFKRGTFRVKGDTIDIYPAYEDFGIRLENDTLTKFDPLTGKKTAVLDKFVVYPAKHYMTDPAQYKDVFEEIRRDLNQRVKQLPPVEAQRLRQRVNYDLEMIQEVGYVNGIENYSRYFDGRKPGDPPYSLMDYLPKDYLLVIDESHMTIPQIRGMYNGDHSRKQTLIDFGFRLPAALDNRPLRFDEFQRRKGQTIYTSATPDEWERAQGPVVEQLVRPTGVVDPEIEVRPTNGQIQDLMKELKSHRALVTTLTKRMAEELTDYLNEHLPELKVAYLHSDIETNERTTILRKLRQGEYDVLVGINLLREGLDLPEITLVAILDADKEGFLRSEVSLIQTMGRGARNINSRVIMYADKVTGSMQRAIDEVRRRRQVQLAWNKKHGITPKTVIKAIRADLFEKIIEEKKSELDVDVDQLLPEERTKLKKVLERRMKEAAKILDFEGAVYYRDYLKQLG
ncbi:excinuclease ABC subunit UvrB [Candidatus Microgenomates bacterium]|nr:excinuclease ABC subunit UvrB [Candidatus Microgenomates bacterium]